MKECKHQNIFTSYGFLPNGGFGIWKACLRCCKILMYVGKSVKSWDEYKRTIK